jgi:hypothetical protein
MVDSKFLHNLKICAYLEETPLLSAYGLIWMVLVIYEGLEFFYSGKN